MPCLVVLFLYSALAGRAESSDAADIRGKQYHVKSVIDGDTIELDNGQRVRYIGINTPETMKKMGNRWAFAPEEYASEASGYNKSLVHNKNVYLEFDSEREDKYGRWLAYVFTGDGKMVNKELVENGYAFVYTFPPNLKHFREFINAQEKAIKSKKGVWSTACEITPLQAGKNTGDVVILRGKVEDINIIFKDVYLTLSGSGGSITVVIPGRNVELFGHDGEDPLKDYKGHIVEVIGKIESRDGLRLTVDNPTQIKVEAVNK